MIDEVYITAITRRIKAGIDDIDSLPPIIAEQVQQELDESTVAE